MKEKQGVFFLIKIVLESYGIPKNLKDEFEEVKRQRCESEKNEMLDNLVKAGVKEGLIREENVFLQRAALETQLRCLLYVLYRHRKKDGVRFRTWNPARICIPEHFKAVRTKKQLTNPA